MQAVHRSPSSSQCMDANSQQDAGVCTEHARTCWAQQHSQVGCHGRGPIHNSHNNAYLPTLSAYNQDQTWHLSCIQEKPQQPDSTSQNLTPANQCQISYTLYTKNYKYTNTKNLKIEKVKNLKIGLPKKIGLKLSFKNRDRCTAFYPKWKGIPEVWRAHWESPRANTFELVRWLLQQKLVSRPKSSSRNITLSLLLMELNDELSQVRWSHTTECLKGV